MSAPRRRAAALAAAALLLVSACGGQDDASPSGDGDDAALSGSITVLAAASLTETFTALADDFEAANDGVEIDLVFDSSGTLADNATAGAPGDVLATADLNAMDRAADAQADEPQVFATNRLVLVTPAENPAGIEALGDLDDPSVTYVICVETAPCGGLSAEVLADAGIDHEPASLEPDVKATLSRVVADEADAGLVYVTDAEAAGDDVQTIELDDEVATDYPIVRLDQSQDAELADAFIAFVLDTAGQETLAVAGFGPGA